MINVLGSQAAEFKERFIYKTICDMLRAQDGVKDVGDFTLALCPTFSTKDAKKVGAEEGGASWTDVYQLTILCNPGHDDVSDQQLERAKEQLESGFGRADLRCLVS